MPRAASTECKVAVIWIDWYAYHVARFRGLLTSPSLKGRTIGLEMVGGIGVHAGLKFREDIPHDLPVETLLPEVAWDDASKWLLAAKLWRRLSELSPEVVLVPGYYTLPGLTIALWAKTHDATSVLMTESTAFDHPRVEWRERLKGFGLRTLFDWAIVGGKAHRAYLHQLGFPHDRIGDGYDVVDNLMFQQGTAGLAGKSSAAYGLPTSKYFLYVGRLAAEKNVAVLVTCWLQYRSEGGAWPLVMVGDGPEASFIRTLLAASPFANHALMPGLKSSEELVPFYAFAGCFVLASTREPWGLVVNEAMASGLPVLVSTACGCAPDLVAEGENGFRFIAKDTVYLSALMHRLEEFSSEQRERMGQRSREIIQGYSPEHFGRSVASIAPLVRSRGRPEASYGGAQ